MRTIYLLKQFTEANTLPENQYFKSLKYLKSNKNDKQKFEFVQQFLIDFKNGYKIMEAAKKYNISKPTAERYKAKSKQTQEI